MVDGLANGSPPSRSPGIRSLSQRSEDDSTSSPRPIALLRTPSQSSFTSRKARLVSRSVDIPASLSLQDLSVHSADHAESFEQVQSESMPKLVRQTTYSSLPPSPRISAALDFGVTPEGVHPDHLEDALSHLDRRSLHEDGWVEDRRSKRDGTTSSDEALDEVDEVEEEFWPARSRRHTLDRPMTAPLVAGPKISRRNTGLSETRRGEVRAVDAGRTTHDDFAATDGATSAEEDKRDPDRPLKNDGKGMGLAASLWDILKDEGGDEVWEGWVADGKWERIANFMAVPLAVEKITMFGALLCLDGFLYNFTVLPIRATFAFYRFFAKRLSRGPAQNLPEMHVSHLHSMLRLLLVIIPTGILLVATDTSKMYHTVRGQDTIKLYVIFNALEIADRLCGAFGQDVLDTLFARETLAPIHRKRGKGRKRQQARPLFFFMLALGYVLAHTLIFFYMLVSLNVAINSYDYTLLSLLISNQFVEIKGSVFKKFEKENLFQIMCADIVERFQLSLMLTVIAIRNTIEMAGSDIAFLPKSFVRGKSLVNSIFSPVVFVIVSEMLVDWLKHAFITKFNHVRASIYDRFTDVLAKDVLVAGSIGDKSGKRRGHPVLLDQSPLVARRLGFASIPLACLLLRVGLQAIGMLTMSSHRHDESSLSRSTNWAWITFKWIAIVGVGLSAWGCLLALKILLGLSLLSFSALRQAGMEEREAEDVVNDFGRAPVGESRAETEYNKETRAYLDQVEDDLDPATSRTEPEGGFPTPRPEFTAAFARDTPDLDSQLETPKPAGGKKGKKWKLEEVERWTMVKRIW